MEPEFVWPWVLGSSRQVAPLPSTLLLNFCLSFSEPPAALLHIISLKLLKPGTGVLATLLLTLQGVDADKQSMKTLAVGAPEWTCPESMLQPWGRCISSSFFPQIFWELVGLFGFFLFFPPLSCCIQNIWLCLSSLGKWTAVIVTTHVGLEHGVLGFRRDQPPWL